MEQVFINATDGYQLDVNVFEVKNAKAVVQVIHGMEEHQERYLSFIEFLNKQGYSVVSSNMRGHGKNAPVLGFFSDKRGYKLLVEDQLMITSFIKGRLKDLPIYIFAHSMGTIITRVLLQGNSKLYDKVVLSGYPNWQAATGFGIMLANLIKFFKGGKYKSKLLNGLSVGAFNKKIENATTNIDWICAREETVKNYLADPLCGIGFTCSAFGDLFKLVDLMHKPKRYKEVNTNLPLLLLSGKDDPCVGGEKGSADSVKVLIKAGFTNIKCVAYEGMRHEILNEKENIKVYNDVLDFFDEKADLEREKIKQTFDNEAGEYDFTSRAVNIYFDEAIDEAVSKINEKQKKTKGKSLKILDVCCGTGILTERVAKVLPEAEFVGVDFSCEMLEVAKQRLKDYNFSCFVSDVCDSKVMADLGQFDLIISSFSLHNVHGLENKQIAFNNVLKHLKVGGQFIYLDIIKGNDKKECEYFYNFQKNWLLRTYDKAKTEEWLKLLNEEDEPETIESNILLLKNAGISDVAVAWQKEFLAIFEGFKKN